MHTHGLTPHGNSKSGADFIRTPIEVFQQMGELAKTMRPKNVYNKLLIDCGETLGPAAPRQVRDKKYRDKRKDLQQITGVNGNRKNLADCVQTVQNMMQQGHSLIQQVIHASGKTPVIILYNDEMLTDIKNLCCSGQTLLGFDKTFNICDVHVTPSVYKQLSVVKTETGEPSLFMDPMFLHA